MVELRHLAYQLQPDAILSWRSCPFSNQKLSGMARPILFRTNARTLRLEYVGSGLTVPLGEPVIALCFEGCKEVLENRRRRALSWRNFVLAALATYARTRSGITSRRLFCDSKCNGFLLPVASVSQRCLEVFVSKQHGRDSVVNG